jgi:serine/threonine protein phosphatase PrpC
MIPALPLVCPRCQAALTPGDRFCEECGARIAAPELPADLSGGRAETLGPGVAGFTDAGLVHTFNQDAFALSGPGTGGAGTLMVVCDGVSNSQTPELAAARAAQVAHDALAAARAGELAPAPSMREAIIRAHDAVCALPFDRQADLDPPATTIVAAWLHPPGLTLGWLGDSRAYHLVAGGGQVLTHDHSWLSQVLTAGEMPEAAARRDPRAHALIHCLGTTDFAKASRCPEPAVAELNARPGWLLLCSDGLWNYAESAAAIAQAASEGLAGEAADLCARLIAFGRNSGGHDNITVLAARTGV